MYLFTTTTSLYTEARLGKLGSEIGPEGPFGSLSRPGPTLGDPVALESKVKDQNHKSEEMQEMLKWK